MPVSYNLRSSQSKKGTPVRQCYLQNFLENKSPEVFDPKVRLKRLKLLERHDIQNSRFYVEKGRITIKPNKSFSMRKLYLLKVFCTIILLVVSSLYWKDYLQNYGITFAKKCAEIHPAVWNYYSDFLKFQRKIFKGVIYKQQKPKNDSGKIISAILEEEITQMPDDFEIQNLIKDYYEELEKTNKIQSTKKQSESFIEDQCKINVDDKFTPVKKNFYNVTVFELINFTDFALESQGAKIISVFETELYGNFSVKFLNYELWPTVSQFLMKYLESFSSNGPNSVLIPWKKPEDCWAFKGSHGRVEIQLSKKIVITAITIDHIPEEIGPQGSIQSAPKKFSVMGIEKCKNQYCKTHLGSFEYKSGGPPTQIFPIHPPMEIPFERIEVVIHSNHGNDRYTCIYKIRVHGH